MKALKRITIFIPCLVGLALIIGIVFKWRQYDEFKSFEKEIIKSSSIIGLAKNTVFAYTVRYPNDSTITTDDITNFIGADTTVEQQGNIAFLYAGVCELFRDGKVKIKKDDSIKKAFIYYEIDSNYTTWINTAKEINFVDFIFLRQNILLIEFNIQPNLQNRTSYLSGEMYSTIPQKSVSIWKSNCVGDEYFIKGKKLQEEINITVYGSFTTDDREKMYFVSKGKDIKATDSSLSFHLTDFKFSDEEIYKKDVKNVITNEELVFYVPNHINCRVNKNELIAQITKPIYFSRFDKCVFELLKEE